jgi:hypothetical protein
MNWRWRTLAVAGLTMASMAVAVQPVSAGSGGISPVAEGSGATSSAAGKYERIWRSFRPGERRWANSTAECESGHNPRAIGGGGMYRGAFQFLRSTWRASPKSPGGDPVAYPYRTQAVVAVLLMRRDGAGHWPVCG